MNNQISLANLNAARQARWGFMVDRAAAVHTGAGAVPIFNIVGGRVAITSIVGQITVAASGATNISLQSNPTAAGFTTGAISGVLAAGGLEVGTLLAIDGTLATATFGVNAGAAQGQTRDVIVPVGQLELLVSAAETISIVWKVFYVPFDTGAYVTAV
jgi:hypothetical protein